MYQETISQTIASRPEGWWDRPREGNEWKHKQGEVVSDADDADEEEEDKLDISFAHSTTETDTF